MKERSLIPGLPRLDRTLSSSREKWPHAESLNHLIPFLLKSFMKVQMRMSTQLV
jgi:hypothetical protein